jgi:hypothetical protein
MAAIHEESPQIRTAIDKNKTDVNSIPIQASKSLPDTKIWIDGVHCKQCRGCKPVTNQHAFCKTHICGCVVGCVERLMKVFVRLFYARGGGVRRGGRRRRRRVRAWDGGGTRRRVCCSFNGLTSTERVKGKAISQKGIAELINSVPSVAPDGTVLKGSKLLSWFENFLSTYVDDYFWSGGQPQL